MNKKNLYLLVIIVILSAGIYLIKNTGGNKRITWDGAESKVTAIAISNKNKNITIVKKDGKWQTVKEHYILRSQDIDKMAAVFTNKRNFEFVSAEKNYNYYQLDADNGLYIKGTYANK
ncbi:MAG TPA: hypothetical protein VKS21_07585, partial [Spirochaetota bacterium]|nr:hypothetical protein [Spirochaetota bacterium]